MKDVIAKILIKAALSQVSTISFPALGTGIQLKYPEDKAAQWMVEGLVKYCNRSPRTSLKTINIVLYDSASKNVSASFM